MVDDPPDPDEIERPRAPPSAQRVARRALALAAMTYRVYLEELPRAEGGPLQAALLGWLSAVDLWIEIEEAEGAFLRAPLGALEPQDVRNADWRTEGLVVLAWALGTMEMLPHDAQGAAQPIAEAFGFLEPEPVILRAPLLRSTDEIESYAERAFAVHWRTRQFSLDHAAMDFVTFAEQAWSGPLDVEGLSFVDRDLEIRGTAIAESPHSSEVNSIAVERHQAANWLRGDAELYSEVGTDT